MSSGRVEGSKYKGKENIATIKFRNLRAAVGIVDAEDMATSGEGSNGRVVVIPRAAISVQS